MEWHLSKKDAALRLFGDSTEFRSGDAHVAFPAPAWQAAVDADHPVAVVVLACRDLLQSWVGPVVDPTGAPIVQATPSTAFYPAQALRMATDSGLTWACRGEEIERWAILTHPPTTLLNAVVARVLVLVGAATDDVSLDIIMARLQAEHPGWILTSSKALWSSVFGPGKPPPSAWRQWPDIVTRAPFDFYALPEGRIGIVTGEIVAQGFRAGRPALALDDDETYCALRALYRLGLSQQDHWSPCYMPSPPALKLAAV